jgi:hypothetical protein
MKLFSKAYGPTVIATERGHTEHGTALNLLDMTHMSHACRTNAVYKEKTDNGRVIMRTRVK